MTTQSGPAGADIPGARPTEKGEHCGHHRRRRSTRSTFAAGVRTIRSQAGRDILRRFALYNAPPGRAGFSPSYTWRGLRLAPSAFRVIVGGATMIIGSELSHRD